MVFMKCTSKGKLLLHEQVIEFIGSDNPSEKQIFEKFPDYSYILQNILDRESRNGLIETYEENKETRYRITKKGTGMLRFTKSIIEHSNC